MDIQLRKALYDYFGYKNFRTGQEEIIMETLQGKNVLGVLPTGTGKSICFQLPARILPGTVVVVSPLISLMIDQVKQLKAIGFKEVVAFNSFMNYSQKKQAFSNLEAYKLIYASPEMLQNEIFMEKLRKLSISLFVIDEAHCISQWGHEFRPDYLKLASVVSQLKNPPVMALSATATPEVQDDIINQLNLEQVSKHVYPMDRDNIAFVVRQVENNEEKMEFLANRLKHFPGPSMIYFSSREWTEKATSHLRNRLPELNLAYYHGGMDQEDRLLIQQQFMSSQLDVICCTSAFGMGINKSDIRMVVHFHLPSQIESFIQEVGRAGRDGKQSVSVVLVAPNDDYIPRKLIESELPKASVIDSVIEKMKKVKNEEGSLPKEELLLIELDLTEIQWRFIKHHLEKSGLLTSKAINGNADEWKQIAEKIKEIILRRNRYKHEKFSELLLWANNRECRRKTLFFSFQDNIKSLEAYCCDICGFQIEEWQPAYDLPDRSEDEWKKEFNQLMLRGKVYGETR